MSVTCFHKVQASLPPGELCSPLLAWGGILQRADAEARGSVECERRGDKTAVLHHKTPKVNILIQKHLYVSLSFLSFLSPLPRCSGLLVRLAGVKWENLDDGLMTQGFTVTFTVWCSLVAVLVYSKFVSRIKCLPKPFFPQESWLFAAFLSFLLSKTRQNSYGGVDCIKQTCLLEGDSSQLGITLGGLSIAVLVCVLK